MTGSRRSSRWLGRFDLNVDVSIGSDGASQQHGRQDRGGDLIETPAGAGGQDPGSWYCAPDAGARGVCSASRRLEERAAKAGLSS
jgi:hypothetical protein